jgi:hypothetical protein
MHSLQNEDAMADILTADKPDRQETVSVRKAWNQVSLLNSKLQVDLPFAKREIGLGWMNGEDLKSLNKLLRLVLLPVVGLGSTIDIYHHLAALQGWNVNELDDMDNAKKSFRAQSIKEWVQNLKLVCERHDDILNVMKDAVIHVQIQLGLGEKRSPQPDIERDATSKTERPLPGSAGFAGYLEQKTNAFYTSKHLTLIEWGKQHGIPMDESLFDHPESSKLDFLQDADSGGLSRRQRNQRQLYLLLFVCIPCYLPSIKSSDIFQYFHGSRIIWNKRNVLSTVCKWAYRLQVVY